MIIGVGGSGKKSICRLAAFAAGNFFYINGESATNYYLESATNDYNSYGSNIDW